MALLCEVREDPTHTPTVGGLLDDSRARDLAMRAAAALGASARGADWTLLLLSGGGGDCSWCTQCVLVSPGAPGALPESLGRDLGVLPPAGPRLLD